jgi:acyl-CoA synthetase (NDP forming)
VFTTMLAGYDAGVFIIDPPRPDLCDPASFEPALQAIEDAAKITGKPAFPVASLPENFDEDRAIAMMARGTVPLMGLETALGALLAAQTPPGLAGWRPLPSRKPTRIVLVDEAAAKGLLETAGIAVPRGVSAPDLQALGAITGQLTPPFALKGMGFAHKSENGAVRLGLQTLQDQPLMIGATGYLAEEMVTGVIAELLIGIRRDPVYGVTLTLGFGGVTAELLADTVTLICPATADEINAALRRLRLWPLLDGYRGRAVADVAAVVNAAMRLQSLMQDESLEEIEINPMMVRAQGAIAADAVIWKENP